MYFPWGYLCHLNNRQETAQSQVTVQLSAVCCIHGPWSCEMTRYLASQSQGRCIHTMYMPCIQRQHNLTYTDNLWMWLWCHLCLTDMDVEIQPVHARHVWGIYKAYNTVWTTFSVYTCQQPMRHFQREQMVVMWNTCLNSDLLLTRYVVLATCVPHNMFAYGKGFHELLCVILPEIKI